MNKLSEYIMNMFECKVFSCNGKGNCHFHPNPSLNDATLFAESRDFIMASPYMFPDQIMHKMTGPLWFPRSKDVTESR
jgi:hypothetical protein